MLKSPPPPEQYDTLGDTASDARPTDDFGTPVADGDPIENLLKLRWMLIEKRRNLAQDAMSYPVVYLGRSQDIAELQKLLHALDEAVNHERAMRDAAGQHDVKQRQQS